MIKLLVEEPGSPTAAELWHAAERCVSSELLYPEARAALAAAERGGRLTAAQLRTAVDELERACFAIELVGADGALARRAGELAEAHGLRGYDAVHLATALAVEVPEVVVVTWDADLARAAGERGRPVAPA